MMRSSALIVSVCAGVLLAMAQSGAGADRIEKVEVDGTVFRVHLASGKILNGPDLAGATLTLAGSGATTPQKVFIESVVVDPMDPDHEVLLYHLLAIDPETKAKHELCNPNAQGERWGFPLRGQWDAEGRHLSDAGYTLTCSDGAQGKCVRFGYKPWKTLANGTRLADYHQACIRMVRADYCGGHGTTRDGMLIDVYDTVGIQQRDAKADEAGVRFEAAWSTTGAVCVAHTRVPENITLDELAKTCPHLAGRLGATACTAESARRFKERVLILNGSR